MNISPDILARVIALKLDQSTMTAVLQIIADATDKPVKRCAVVAKAYRLGPDFIPSDEMTVYARDLGLSDAEITHEGEKMMNWSRSSPKGAKMDWFATWKNWILAYKERNGTGRITGKPSALSTLQAIADGNEPNDDLFSASRAPGPVRQTIEGSLVSFPKRA